MFCLRVNLKQTYHENLYTSEMISMSGFFKPSCLSFDLGPHLSHAHIGLLYRESLQASAWEHPLCLDNQSPACPSCESCQASLARIINSSFGVLVCFHALTGLACSWLWSSLSLLGTQQGLQWGREPIIRVSFSTCVRIFNTYFCSCFSWCLLYFICINLFFSTSHSAINSPPANKCHSMAMEENV